MQRLTRLLRVHAGCLAAGVRVGHVAHGRAEAVEMLRAAALRHADHFQALQMLGIVQAGRPDGRYWAESRDAYQQALMAAPQNPWEHMNMARPTARMGLAEAAKTHYDAGLRLSRPGALVPILTLAELRLKAGDPAHAERLVRPIAADPLRPSLRAFELLGRAEAAQGRTDEAAATLRNGQARFPNRCSLYDAAGAMLLNASRDDEAFAQWQAGVRAVPKCDVTYLHHARALIDRNRVPEARKLLETLIKLSPGSDGAEMARPLLAKMGARPPG